jgi:hypothetical protein
MLRLQGLLRFGSVILFLATAGLAAAGPISSPTPVKTDGTPVNGAVSAPGTEDWFAFDATAGGQYVASTIALSHGMDTVLRVLDPSGALVGQDDDSGGNLASKLSFTASANGRYTIGVRHYWSQKTGTFKVKVVGPPPAAPTPTPPPPPPSPTLPSATAIAVDGPLVFDPRLEDGNGGLVGSMTITCLADGPASTYQARVIILDAASATRRTLLAGDTRTSATPFTLTWDGTDDQGRAVAPGAYVIRFDAGSTFAGTADRAVDLVRLGARSLRFLDDGANGTRVPVSYHAMNNQPRSYFAVDSGGPQWTLPASPLGDGALDDATGAALAGPTPWTNLGSPPLDSGGHVLAKGRSLPVAYTGGATMHVEAWLGDRAFGGSAAAGALCGYPIANVPLRVSAGAAASVPVSPGDKVTLEVATTLQVGLGKRARTVELRFEYEENGAWKPVAGLQTAQVLVYTLLGGSKLSTSGGPATDARELPFVAAVDEVAGWTSTSDPNAVLETVTRTINSSKGLTYDVVSGSSQYADGSSLNTPDLAFSEFLSGKSRGSIVNCSDCASLVSVYSRNVGVDCEIYILGWDFPLNYIKGIGQTDWKQAVFTNGISSFYYHAVASATSGNTIWDACLAVDDGPNPGQVEPRVEVLPVDMPYAHYKQKLTSGSFDRQSHGRPTQN